MRREGMRVDPSEREQTVSCTTSTSGSAPACPVCGGVLVPMRSAWRCSRCYFSLCAGCEPEFLPVPTSEA
jgi:hypothetical protein